MYFPFEQRKAFAIAELLSQHFCMIHTYIHIEKLCLIRYFVIKQSFMKIWLFNIRSLFLSLTSSLSRLSLSCCSVRGKQPMGMQSTSDLIL